jgi:hypothetical protein
MGGTAVTTTVAAVVAGVVVRGGLSGMIVSSGSSSFSERFSGVPMGVPKDSLTFDSSSLDGGSPLDLVLGRKGELVLADAAARPLSSARLISFERLSLSRR